MFKISQENTRAEKVFMKDKINKNKSDIDKLRSSIFQMSTQPCGLKQSVVFVFRHLDEISTQQQSSYGNRNIWNNGKNNTVAGSVRQISYPSSQLDRKTPLGFNQSINIANNLPQYVTQNNWNDIQTIHLHDPTVVQPGYNTQSTGDPFETFYPYIRRLTNQALYNTEATSVPNINPIVPTEGIIDVNFYPLSGNYDKKNYPNLTDVMTSDYIYAVDNINKCKPYSSVFCGTKETLFGPNQKLSDGTLLSLLNQLYKITESSPNFANYFNNGPPPKAGMFVYYFDENGNGRVVQNNTISTSTPNYNLP